MKNHINYEDIQKRFNVLLNELIKNKVSVKQSESLNAKDWKDINNSLLIFKENLKTSKDTK
ncbi:hypothetical protein [Aliarcobacter butzleri]|uniref:hypothetical protein n=1 Tax=Aliarcobacter butzleri TaxID=28197 RepID=UPI003AF62735